MEQVTEPQSAEPQPEAAMRESVHTALDSDRLHLIRDRFEALLTSLDTSFEASDTAEALSDHKEELIGIVARHDCRHIDCAAASQREQLLASAQAARIDDVEHHTAVAALLDGRREFLLDLNKGAVVQIVPPVQAELLSLRR